MLLVIRDLADAEVLLSSGAQFRFTRVEMAAALARLPDRQAANSAALDINRTLRPCGCFFAAAMVLPTLMSTIALLVSGTINVESYWAIAAVTVLPAATAALIGKVLGIALSVWTYRQRSKALITILRYASLTEN